MSLNPNGYQLSDRVGKLTAYGKFYKKNKENWKKKQKISEIYFKWKDIFIINT